MIMRNVQRCHIFHFTIAFDSFTKEKEMNLEHSGGYKAESGDKANIDTRSSNERILRVKSKQYNSNGNARICFN